MGIAGNIDQDVPEHAIDQPGRHAAACFDLLERDAEFVDRVVAGFIDTGRLAGRADEEAAEQPGQGRVIVPVADQALEEVRSTQQRRVGGGRTSECDVVAAAGPDMATVHHEFLGTQPGLAGFLVKDVGLFHQLSPGGRWVDIDLDHARIRCHA